MKFIATGKVHPERACVNIPQVVQRNATGSLQLFCGASQIAIHIDDPRIDNVDTAHMNAEHYAQAMISALGFANGCGYIAEITQVLIDDGDVYVIGVQEQALISENHDADYTDALELGLKDPFFRFALLDYTSAIIDKVGCAHSCFRAIESLSKAIGGSKKDSHNWKMLHGALGTDEESIKRSVKRYADPIRHGNWVGLISMTWDERVAMLAFTRDILMRYMKFRLDKSQVVVE